MKVVNISLICLMFGFASVNGYDLDAQLRAIEQVEAAGKRAQAAEDARRAAAAEKQRQQRAAAAERARKEKVAQQRAAEQKQQRINEREYNEYMADKKRDQEYEDLKRELEIEAMRAELAEKKAMSKARANRADEYATQDLNRLGAQTDLIQSEADATRGVAKGIENRLNKEGDARIKESGKLF